MNLERPRPNFRNEESSFREREQAPRLRQETLEICPNCGEPVLGPHKCNELSELIKEHGYESAIGKLLLPILEEAKKMWGQGRANLDSVQMTITGVPKEQKQEKPSGRDIAEEEEPPKFRTLEED